MFIQIFYFISAAIIFQVKKNLVQCSTKKKIFKNIAL